MGYTDMKKTNKILVETKDHTKFVAVNATDDSRSNTMEKLTQTNQLQQEMHQQKQ